MLRLAVATFGPRTFEQTSPEQRTLPVVQNSEVAAFPRSRFETPTMGAIGDVDEGKKEREDVFGDPLSDPLGKMRFGSASPFGNLYLKVHFAPVCSILRVAVVGMLMLYCSFALVRAWT